ncbi:MAG: hypothetical protein ACSLEN_04985 [Candidatus Malihini olakiniferum]
MDTPHHAQAVMAQGFPHKMQKTHATLLMCCSNISATVRKTSKGFIAMHQIRKVIR